MKDEPKPAPTAPTVLTVDASFVDAFAKANAAANKAALRPENDPDPAVSVFNPSGERDHPKAKLDRETIWCGYRLSNEEVSPEEVALLNRLTGGTFRDGKWTVIERKAAPGQVGRIDVRLPAQDIDSRMELPRTIREICLEMLGEASRATEFVHLADAQAEITRLRALLDTATTPA